MTPSQDRRIRRRAQFIYELATEALERTDEPKIRYGGENWREEHDRRQAYHATTEYAALQKLRSEFHEVQRIAEYRRRHPIVRLLRRSRYLGQVARGEYGEPSERFHWHWQNLDEDLPQRSASTVLFGALGLPRLAHQGRAWFAWYVTNSPKPFKWEVDWELGTAVHDWGVSVARSGGGSVSIHAAFRPLVSFYLTFKHLLPRRADEGRTSYSISLSRDMWSLHYDLGKSGDGMSWDSRDPNGDNWRQGVVFLVDALFGRADCVVEKIGEPVAAIACFPEGQYPLKLQRQTYTWTHPRWPFPMTRKSVDITLERPPQFHGKGENAWDCGPDAIYGMSSEGHSFEDAVAAYTKSVLRERAKRGHLAPEHRSVQLPV